MTNDRPQTGEYAVIRAGRGVVHSHVIAAVAVVFVGFALA
jgi:hypothetical protein